MASRPRSEDRPYLICTAGAAARTVSSASLPTAVLERTHSWRNGAPSALEESRDDRSINEAANMSRIRHTTARGGAALHLMHYRPQVQALHQKPHADEQDGGDVRHPHEHEDDEERANLVARVGDHEGAHRRGNRATRAQVCNLRRRIDNDLSSSRRQPAEQVENEVAPATHQILDLRPEGP